jgi:transposase
MVNIAEGNIMLSPTPPEPASKFDQFLFEMFVPQDHYLRKVMASIDFENSRPRLASFYSPTMGRHAVDPVLMLKILFLCFQYHLSDRLVMERITTDMAFRCFLGLGGKDQVPDHTNGTHFRERLGDEGFRQIFQDLLTQAREYGLLSDRLRLKDATHILADIADLRPIALVAEVREALWKAAKRFFADTVSQQRTTYEALRHSTAALPDDERLARRVNHLREVRAVLQQQWNDLPTTDQEGKPGQRLQRALAIARKLLDDCDHPQQGDRLASATDPDARLGKHHQFYVGYLLDVTMDPMSELITAVNVLANNSTEAADAVTLIRQEEQAQGNKVESLSMDGSGYNGPVLRELSDPQGLNLDVTVPPKAAPERSTFPAERFALTVLDNGTRVLTCPAGHTSGPGKPNTQKYTTLFRFQGKDCRACPLREQCLENPASQKGRTVQKNDYQTEYDKVAAKAQTPEYQETRRIHPKVERKLNEVVRHHHGRRARYRGIFKVLAQAFLTATTVNIKRIVKLIVDAVRIVAPAPPVRAEQAGT